MIVVSETLSRLDVGSSVVSVLEFEVEDVFVVEVVVVIVVEVVVVLVVGVVVVVVVVVEDEKGVVFSTCSVSSPLCFGISGDDSFELVVVDVNVVDVLVVELVSVVVIVVGVVLAVDEEVVVDKVVSSTISA